MHYISFALPWAHNFMLTTEAATAEDSNIFSMDTVVSANSIVGTREESGGRGRTGNIIEPYWSCAC